MPRNATTSSILFILFPIIVIVVSFFSGIAGSFVGNKLIERSNAANTTSAIREVVTEDSAIINVAYNSQPSVVSIIISKDIPVYEDLLWDGSWEDYFFGNRQEQTGTEEQQIGAGSGFIVSEDGLILTNRHVVSDEGAKYSVILNSGETLDAEVLARDTVLDIAIIKVESDADLVSLPLGDSDVIKVGQRVIAIGNSLGEFSNTVSSGIISGLGRNITAQDGDSAEVLENIIQTDTSINLGNSGGPLLDLAGNVVGVNVAIAADAENVGFAIPINLVKIVINSVIEFGEIQRPYLGVRYIPITSSLQESENLPVGFGALVASGNDAEEAVISGSPAQKAGIVEGDIILELNGNKITLQNSLQSEIQKYGIGDSVSVKYLHGNAEEIIDITLEKRP